LRGHSTDAPTIDGRGSTNNGGWGSCVTTVDRHAFGTLVREALANVYDEVFLESHPLCGLLVGVSDNAGTRLQQSLFDAIEELRPTPRSPADSARSRLYRYLRCRYVDQEPLDRLADTMAVGDRQARRYNHEGVEAVTNVLWTRLTRRQLSASRPTDASIAVSGSSGRTPVNRELETELAHLARTAPEGPTSLGDTLESVLVTVAKLIRRHRVRLDVSLPPDLPPVAAHRVVLRQILLGLLVHAVERHAGSPVRLTAEDHGQVLRLSVAIGRDPLPRPQGTGGNPEGEWEGDDPGLAITRHVIESLHGGWKIRGRDGAELIAVDLPLTRFLTVLLIDDNLDFLRLFEWFLEDSPYRVVHAGPTDDPIQRAQEERPDVIVLDVLMPTQDGWEILQALKAHPAVGHIPVVVCSVLQDPTLALALGAAASLSKPLNRRILLDTLDRCHPSHRSAERQDPAAHRA
jgi:CheY-like chemotaxis protein